MSINASDRDIQPSFLGKGFQVALIATLLPVANGCRGKVTEVLQKPQSGHPTALKDETQNESHVLQQSGIEGRDIKTSEELQKPEWMKNFDNSRSYAKEAKEHQDAGRLEEAITSLTEAIKCNHLVLEEKDLEGVHLLAQINIREFLDKRAELHQLQKQFVEEIRDYEEYTDFNNKNNQPEFNNYVLCDRAFALQNLEKWPEAIKEYERAIEAEISPPDPRPAFALSELYRACTDMSFRNPELAAKYALVAQDIEKKRVVWQKNFDDFNSRDGGLGKRHRERLRQRHFEDGNYILD